MIEHITIPTFSPGWWLGFWISVLVIISIIGIAKRLSPEAESKLRLILGSILILREIINQLFMWFSDTWYVSLSLPLQLCGISSLLSAFLLLSPRQWAFEFLALLGLAGALHSFLTPELTHGATMYHFFDYYLSHGGIIMTVFYMHLVHGMRPKLDAWWKVFLLGNAVLLTVGTINYMVSANYIFLCEAPKAANPLVMGPWPYYIIGFEVAGLLHIVLFHRLFRSSLRLIPIFGSNRSVDEK